MMHCCQMLLSIASYFGFKFNLRRYNWDNIRCFSQYATSIILNPNFHSANLADVDGRGLHSFTSQLIDWGKIMHRMVGYVEPESRRV
jgi:hypothetical protein